MNIVLAVLYQILTCKNPSSKFMIFLTKELLYCFSINVEILCSFYSAFVIIRINTHNFDHFVRVCYSNEV